MAHLQLLCVMVNSTIRTTQAGMCASSRSYADRCAQYNVNSNSWVCNSELKQTTMPPVCRWVMFRLRLQWCSQDLSGGRFHNERESETGAWGSPSGVRIQSFRGGSHKGKTTETESFFLAFW